MFSHSAGASISGDVSEVRAEPEGVLVFWLVLAGECVCMTLLAEWLCVRSELADIPLPSALVSAGGGGGGTRAASSGGASPAPSPLAPAHSDSGSASGAAVASTGATEERTHNGRRYVRLKD